MTACGGVIHPRSGKLIPFSTIKAKAAYRMALVDSQLPIVRQAVYQHGSIEAARRIKQRPIKQTATVQSAESLGL